MAAKSNKEVPRQQPQKPQTNSDKRIHDSEIKGKPVDSDRPKKSK